MASRSNFLAWKIPWTEEPGGLQSMGSQRAQHNWAHTDIQTAFSSLFCAWHCFISEQGVPLPQESLHFSWRKINKHKKKTTSDIAKGYKKLSDGRKSEWYFGW